MTLKAHLLSTLILATAAISGARAETFVGALEGSSTYPGTRHTYSVVVPDSIDTDSAALYIGLDGVLCNAPAVIDSLARAGVMPPAVQIYLQSGLITDGDRVLRYNRSNEFDATDGRFADFLIDELLPHVESTLAEARCPITLTRRPDRTMIFGLSSGGIAAFTAAWHRPDRIGRVFSGCGTFVPMRGAHDLQAIVRKHEPLPIKIFLQDGYSDTWNPTFGSWYEANRILASALEFGGYDCAFDWAEGGHSVKRATEIFADVLTWMWSDYQLPIEARPTTNGLLAVLLEGDSGWQPVTGNSPLPAWDAREAVYPDSALVAVADYGRVDQFIIADGERLYGQPFYWLHTYGYDPADVQGLHFDGLGNLWVLTDAGIQICDQNGRVRGILRLPVGLDKHRLAMAADGDTVYVTDGSATYSRRLNITPPQPGVTPLSQGQG